jgi:hypothetical protein
MAQQALEVSVSPAALSPRVRWSWLWGQRNDVLWTLLPFWLGFLFLALIAGTTAPTNTMWSFTLGGHKFSVMRTLLYLYGPLVDAPHLWATIARTYTDREEWATRRRLFLGSLAAFAIGPVIVLLPYLVRAVASVPASFAQSGWLIWSTLFSFYALYHINKQHWGFVCLYNRKGGDTAHKAETRADALFFQTAIWLPYVAMVVAPWYTDADGDPLRVMHTAIGSTTLGAILNMACRVAFFIVCAAYVAFQVNQWRKGHARNGTKLLYVATVISLYYLTFAIDPRIASFWVIITGTGHCAQYHAVVWAYGQKRYAPKPEKSSDLPTRIFANVWLYILLGVAFGLVTLQGPGADVAKRLVASVLQAGFFSHVLSFLDRAAGQDLGYKVMTAMISGVRLHHFYVDSKIWRVSKSAALAKNLNVEMPKGAPA